MPNTVLVIVSCLASYLLGSLPFGLWVGLLWKQVDIRTLGSKNIGATNVLRVLGPAPGATVFLLDTLKGAVGVLLFRVLWVQVLPPPILGEHGAPLSLQILVGFLAIAGHTLSPFLRFKGGKGVATSLGALLALWWPVALIGLLSWLVMVAITRYVSLASLVAAWSLPFAAWLTLNELPERLWMLGICSVLALLVTVKHRDNMRRLLDGTESKIGQRAAPAPEAPVTEGSR